MKSPHKSQFHFLILCNRLPSFDLSNRVHTQSRRNSRFRSPMTVGTFFLYFVLDICPKYLNILGKEYRPHYFSISNLP
jgi:hypothetical protein